MKVTSCKKWADWPLFSDPIFANDIAGTRVMRKMNQLLCLSSWSARSSQILKHSKGTPSANASYKFGVFASGDIRLPALSVHPSLAPAVATEHAGEAALAAAVSVALELRQRDVVHGPSRSLIVAEENMICQMSRCAV